MTAIAHPAPATRGAVLMIAALGVALVALTVAAPALHWRFGGWVLVAVFAAGALGAWAAANLAEQVDQHAALLVILAGAVALRLALLFVEPYLSSDIYRYIWDGRVQAAGINPYRYVPKAEELAFLRDAAVWPGINRPDYAVTIYPPTAQAIFLAITRFGQSVVAMKLGLLAFEAAAVWALIALLHRQGAPATRVALYAWHPLPVWEIAGNGHVDAAMLAFLLVGLLLFLQGRTLLAGITVTLGALVKPMALLALPVFWRPWNWRLPLAVAVTIALAYLPYLSVGWGVLGFLPGYLHEEGLASGDGFRLPWLLQQLTGPLPGVNTLYIVLAALALGALALAAGFRADRSERSAIHWLSWLLIAFLILSSPHYPWYFVALVPFLALNPTAAAWVLTTACVLFYDVVGNDGLPGYTSRIAVFSFATLAALTFDLRRVRQASSSHATGESA